jgi:hypothetical protein
MPGYSIAIAVRRRGICWGSAPRATEISDRKAILTIQGTERAQRRAGARFATLQRARARCRREADKMRLNTRFASINSPLR